MNYELLDKLFSEFEEYIEEKDGKFFSFEAQPYLKKNESYKYKVHAIGNEKLNISDWKATDIGSGKIIQSIKDAINIDDNNLVLHDNRNGENSRPDKSLYKKYSAKELTEYEQALFDFYRDNVPDIESFNRIIKFSGKRYSFVAYLFFLKSKKKYLPIAPDTFDQIFKRLEIDLITSKHCSWDNYQNYISTLQSVQNYLQNKCKFDNEEITLLDTHTFLWILQTYMQNWSPKRELNSIISPIFKEIKVEKREIEYSSSSNSNSDQKINFLEDQKRKKRLGDKAEEIVLKYENQFFKNVKNVSDDPSIGYDIEVKNELNEVVKRIEVKTESYNCSFIITINEIQKSMKFNDYYIYVVSNLDSENPTIKSIKVSNILDELTCMPVQYRVYF